MAWPVSFNHDISPPMHDTDHTADGSSIVGSTLKKIGKGSWTKEEDGKLIQLVEEYGHAWKKLARSLDGRNGKQCRERFVNHLDADIKKGSWSEEEDKMLLSIQLKYGNKWAFISTLLDGRTACEVKNRFKSISRRVQKREFHSKMSTSISLPKAPPVAARRYSPFATVDTFLHDEYSKHRCHDHHLGGCSHEGYISDNLEYANSQHFSNSFHGRSNLMSKKKLEKNGVSSSYNLMSSIKDSLTVGKSVDNQLSGNQTIMPIISPLRTNSTENVYDNSVSAHLFGPYEASTIANLPCQNDYLEHINYQTTKNAPGKRKGDFM